MMKVITSSHFDKKALSDKSQRVQELQTKVDFHASIVKLARHCQMHLPKLIIGDGQGALIAAGFARPGVVEAALLSRNVQQEEARRMAEA